MHKVRQVVIGLSLAVAAACKEPTGNEPPGDYTVRVFNDSPVAVSNIRVRVSDDDEFTVTRLEHGDMSTRFITRSIHTNPAVTLTVDGETLTSTPVEGFSGFNPALSPGAYIVVVSVAGSPRRLAISVQQPVED
jgi:hypothetical protein